MRLARLAPTYAMFAAILAACGGSPSAGGSAATADAGSPETGPDGAATHADAAASSGGDAAPEGGSVEGGTGAMEAGGAEAGAGDTDSGGGGVDASDGGMTLVDAPTGTEEKTLESGGTGADASTDAASTGIGPGSDKCSTATVIPLSSQHVDLPASNAGAAHDIDAPCATGSGPDVFYQFTVSRPVIVYADTFGATWNTALYLLSGACAPMTASTMTGDAVCNDDGCSTQQSQVVALLAPGNYKLGLTGTGGATGSATIHFEVAPAASGTETQLPQGVSTQTGTTVGASGNVDDLSTTCAADGPEDGYWWASCPTATAGQLQASTCGEATWETVLAVEIPQLATAYSCSVDSCFPDTSLTQTIPAGSGLRVLFVDGQAGTSAGHYSVNVTRP